ncbi:MAG TPA: hypothetical protein VLH35_03430, partial [Candidatus Acidoferrales bacterium]|nr:hypothetical protein [Candidatus Acidoferrales bacterium]
MTEKTTPSQITNINTQIDKLKQQTVENNAQIKKFIEKRDALHEKVRKTRDEVNQIKTERDALNEKVKQLKLQRDAVRVNVAPIMAEINALDEKIETLKKGLPRINYRETKKELEELEFKIATTTVDIQEEKRLVDQVKQLEIQLSGFKKVEIQRKKIKELLEHRKTFDSQADVYHKELTELAKKSQDLHAVMMDKLNTIKRDRTEADELHQSFIKMKETNNQIYDQIRVLIAQSTGIRVAMREQYHARKSEYESRRKDQDARRKEDDAKRQKEQAERTAKEKVLKDKIGGEAREKLARGEKVSWEEIALSYGDD